jgi:hypothetical protein
MTVIDEELFNLIRQEHKGGHSESYSALLHEIEVEMIRKIVNAESYEAFSIEAS